MNGYGIIRLFGVVALFAFASVHCAKIHDEMTDEEIANLFHTTRENIPEYDVVPIRHNLYKRSNSYLQLQFNAFGKKIDAFLKPSDGQLAGRNTPVWLAFSKPDGTVEYKKMRDDIVGIVAGFFNSPIDLSTVVVSESQGKESPSFEGEVASLLVRPLPARFQEAAKKKRSIEDSNASRTLLETHYHVIIKSRPIEEEKKLRDLESQINEISKSANKTASKMKRSTKDTIYPSVLVCTDYTDSKTTQNDLAYYDEIMYQLAFWNAVDMRYRHVDDPKVRLRISGIVIGQDRGAAPYFKKHMFKDTIKVSEAWMDLQTYYGGLSKNPDFPLQAYDIIAIMSNQGMLGMTEKGIGPILGMAQYRALCMDVYDRYHSVAIIHDKGGFDGVLTAAHELGHIMGLSHDGTRGDKCDQSHGYIMQPSNIVTLKNLEWSPCSLDALSYFLRTWMVNCVDQPAEVHPPGPEVPRFLPGDVVDTHKQCQGRGFSWACDPYPEMCTHMNCYHTGWAGLTRGWWCQNSGPAAEGTACAPGHKCVDGVCQCMTEECIFEKKE